MSMWDRCPELDKSQEKKELESQLLAAQAEVGRLREALDSIRPHCQAIVDVDGKTTFCGNTGTHHVDWSDRSLGVCPDHIEYAKESAANDGISDRTDHPYIQEIRPPLLGRLVDSLLATPSGLSALSAHDAGIRKEAAREALEKAAARLDAIIPRGQLQGNGCDQHAQRNGTVLAYNELHSMIAELDQPTGKEPT